MSNYKLYMAGEKSRAICPHCTTMVTTTFFYRDIPFNDGNGIAKNILASVCDECNAVVGIPAQSTPAIRQARQKAEIPLEIMLSAPDVEILDIAAYQVDPQATSRFRKAIFAYYFEKLRKNPTRLKSVNEELTLWSKARKAAIKSPAPTRRVSLKLSNHTEKTVQFLMKESGLTKTKLARTVIMLVEEELLNKKTQGALQDLQNIAIAVNA